MNIFDGIEKLINEHGSAKILGERLLLAKDQNTAQEKRIAELERQLKESETEKTTLRSQLQQSTAENKKAENLIKQLQDASSHINSSSSPTCPNCSTPQKPVYMSAYPKFAVNDMGRTHHCTKCGFS